MPPAVRLQLSRRQEAQQAQQAQLDPVPEPVARVALLLLCLTWLVFVLRVCTRASLRRLGLDDATMGITMVFFTIFGAATVGDVSLIASTIWQLTNLALVSMAINIVIVAVVFYILTMLAFKISIGLFYLRIFEKKWQRRTVYGVMAVSTIFSLVAFFFAIFHCGTPKSGLLVYTRQRDGQCSSDASVLGIGYTHALIVSTTDWLYAIMPIPLLMETRIPKREKVIVGGILALGAIGSICSLVRFGYIHQLTSKSSGWLNFAMWSVLEAGLGIVANCLATLRPLLRSILWITPPESSLRTMTPILQKSVGRATPEEMSTRSTFYYRDRKSLATFTVTR